MDADSFKQYLADRYNEEISWYSDKSSSNKLRYQIFQWGVIVLSATVPVLVVSVPDEYQLITIVVSIALAIGTAGLKTFKFQENCKKSGSNLTLTLNEFWEV